MLADHPNPTRKRREPLEGDALLAFVSKLVAEGYSAAFIARKASIPLPRAERLKRDILRDANESLGLGLTDEEKERIRRDNVDYLVRARDDSITSYKHSVREGRPNARQHNPGLAAVKHLNVMLGLDAPSRSESFNVNASVMVDPAFQQRMLQDPDLLRLQLALEERQRELLADLERRGLPGPVRGGDEQGQVEVGPAPPGDQQAPAGGGGGPRPEGDDLRPAEARQE